MKKTLAVAALMLWASCIFASPAQVMTCGTGQQDDQQDIVTSAFTLGFSCTVTSTSVLIPIDEHGDNGNLDDYYVGTLSTWDYSLTLLSANVQGLSLSGVYVDIGGQPGNDTATWTLTGVGNTVYFSATGYTPTLDAMTIDTGGNSLTVFIPGPVPEAPTLVLAATGLALLGLCAKRLRARRPSSPYLPVA